MPAILDTLRANVAYAFVAVGVVWLVVAVLTASPLLAWPLIACLVAGGLLKLRPGERFTWAWAVSSATMGFLVAGYEAYFWGPLVGGAFSSLASLSIGGFAVLALVHAFLAYAGGVSPKAAKSADSG